VGGRRGVGGTDTETQRGAGCRERAYRKWERGRPRGGEGGMLEPEKRRLRVQGEMLATSEPSPPALASLVVTPRCPPHRQSPLSRPPAMPRGSLPRTRETLDTPIQALCPSAPLAPCLHSTAGPALSNSWAQWVPLQCGYSPGLRFQR